MPKIITFRKGQEYAYKGNIKSFPKTVKVVVHPEKPTREVMKRIGGLMVASTVDNLVLEAPNGELHGLFVVRLHAKDWRLTLNPR